MNNHRDIQGIRRIVRQESPPPLTPGRVVAKLLRGVRVQLTGSNLTVEAEVIRGADVNVGDDVVAIRLEGQHKWIVLGASDRSSPSSVSSGSAPDSSSSPLAPPDGVRAYNGWGFIVVAWSVPIQRPDISFQVQVEDDVDGSENVEYFTTAGSSYLYVAPPGTRKRFRVCTVDKNYRKSGWSAFVTGQSEGIFFATGMSTNLPDPAALGEGEPFYAFDTKALYVVHNQVWEKIAGGSGDDSSPVDPGTGPGYWDPVLPPEQTNPLNNEFTATWDDFELQLVEGTTSVKISNGAAILQGSGFTEGGLLRRDLPTGPWTATVRFRVAAMTNPKQLSALQVGVFAASSEPSAGAMTLPVAGWVLMGSGSEKLELISPAYLPPSVLFGVAGVGAVDWPSAALGDWAYARLRCSGDRKIFTDFSNDGITWFSSQGTLPESPKWFGIAFWASTPDFVALPGLEIDFFRFVNESVAPSDPVYGRWVGTNLSTRANVVGDVVAFTHNTVSPLELGDVEAGDHIHACKVFIDEPFDGTVSLSVGEPGAPGRLIDASMIDPKEAGLYESWPEYTYQGATSLHLHLAKSGTTQGAGRVILLRKERYNG